MHCEMCAKVLGNPKDPRSVAVGQFCMDCAEDVAEAENPKKRDDDDEVAETTTSQSREDLLDLSLPVQHIKLREDTAEVAKLRQDFGLDRCRVKPYIHQVISIELLIKNKFFALWSEMGAGKSAMIIAAAQVLFERGEINQVVIITPASVRSVWWDESLGELSKHLWLSTPCEVYLYRGRGKTWYWPDRNAANNPKRLKITITNYEYLVNKERRDELCRQVNRKTFLVLDESSSIKSSKAKRSKACFKIRKRCGRIAILNGTPISNSPMDLFNQGQILSPEILECNDKTEFRDRYADITTKYGFAKIVRWKNLEDLQRRFAPYVVRHLKKDCLDLPEKLPAVALTATLTPTTWKIYKSMRDEFVIWLKNHQINDMVTAQQVVVKAMRLAQITSGFVGGIEKPVIDEDVFVDDDTHIHPIDLPMFDGPETILKDGTKIREIGREKLETFFSWYSEKLDEDPSFKMIVGCRFRFELARLIATMKEKHPEVLIGEIRGGQNNDDRNYALRLLDPRTTAKDKAVLVGCTTAGSMGLNLTAANTIFRMSNTYSLYLTLQFEDRIHRPGQVSNCSYFDLVATGPDGQKTIDSQIIKALRQKQEIADWTTSAWIRAVED